MEKSIGIDQNGKETFIGDFVHGEGFQDFNMGFKIDRRPVVQVREKDGVIYFGGLSKQSFNKFWKVDDHYKPESNNF